MGVRNVNALEEHVEKIVLAVAAAGAAFLGYLAFQPITIPGTEVGPGDVENQIASEIGRLEQARQTVAEHKPTIPNIDFLAMYRQLATKEPLDNTLLALNVPSFGPKNLASNAVPVTPDLGNYHLATPTPVAPVNPSVEAWQQQVGILPEGMAPVGAAVAAANVVPLQAGVQLPTRDQNAALIQGYIPVGRMLLEMAKVQDPKERIPPNLAKVVIYRILTERHEQTPNGWTDWKQVPPTKATVAPTVIDWSAVGDSLDGTLAQVDSEFKQIVLPDFYVDVNGVPIQAAILNRQLPDPLKSENTKLQDELRSAGLLLGGTGGMLPGGGPGFVPMYGTPTGGITPATAPGGGTAVPGAPVQPLTLEQIKSMPIMPFCFWDETVLPSHTYQYRVQVEIINPTYHWNFGLKNPAMQKTPLLTTGWVLIPQPVVIHPDIAFFVLGGGSMSSGPATTISARVFKKSNGKWYKGEFTTPTGMNIAGRIDLVDKEGVPKMDVDTRFTVVDIQEAGSGVHVILKDPSGNLITRDSATDFNNPENKDLLKKVEVRPVAAAPTPAETTSPLPTAPPLPPGVINSPSGPMYSNPSIRPVTPAPAPATRPAPPVRVNPGRGG